MFNMQRKTQIWLHNYTWQKLRERRLHYFLRFNSPFTSLFAVLQYKASEHKILDVSEATIYRCSWESRPTIPTNIFQKFMLAFTLITSAYCYYENIIMSSTGPCLCCCLLYFIMTEFLAMWVQCDNTDPLKLMMHICCKSQLFNATKSNALTRISRYSYLDSRVLNNTQI